MTLLEYRHPAARPQDLINKQKDPAIKSQDDGV